LASVAFSKLIHAFAFILLFAHITVVEDPFNARIAIKCTIDRNEIIVTAEAFMKFNRFYILELA
jgi:hypothetical protein